MTEDPKWEIFRFCFILILFNYFVGRLEFVCSVFFFFFFGGYFFFFRFSFSFPSFSLPPVTCVGALQEEIRYRVAYMYMPAWDNAIMHRAMDSLIAFCILYTSMDRGGPLSTSISLSFSRCAGTHFELESGCSLSLSLSGVAVDYAFRAFFLFSFLLPFS